jgi:hypothetical protein
MPQYLPPAVAGVSLFAVVPGFPSDFLGRRYRACSIRYPGVSLSGLRSWYGQSSGCLLARVAADRVSAVGFEVWAWWFGVDVGCRHGPCRSGIARCRCWAAVPVSVGSGGVLMWFLRGSALLVVVRGWLMVCAPLLALDAVAARFASLLGPRRRSWRLVSLFEGFVDVRSRSYGRRGVLVAALGGCGSSCMVARCGVYRHPWGFVAGDGCVVVVPNGRRRRWGVAATCRGRRPSVEAEECS